MAKLNSGIITRINNASGSQKFDFLKNRWLFYNIFFPFFRSRGNPYLKSTYEAVCFSPCCGL